MSKYNSKTMLKTRYKKSIIPLNIALLLSLHILPTAKCQAN